MITEDRKDCVPMDYVYVGRRTGAKSGKLYVALCPITSQGIGDEMWFAHRAAMHRKIGSTYTGAEFSPAGRALGLAEAKWSGHGEHGTQDDRIRWETLDKKAAADDRAAKMEKDAGRVSEIEKTLLPLRRQYEAYRKQGDFAGMNALEQVALMTLRKSPRSNE